MIAPYVPCVALHVENTHVERYEQEVRSLFPDTTIVSVPPILYIQSVSRISSYNEHLYRKLVLQFGAGRMKAHRIYRLDHCCSDPEWIVKCLERRRRETACNSHCCVSTNAARRIKTHAFGSKLHTESYTSHANA